MGFDIIYVLAVPQVDGLGVGSGCWTVLQGYDLNRHPGFGVLLYPSRLLLPEAQLLAMDYLEFHPPTRPMFPVRPENVGDAHGNYRLDARQDELLAHLVAQKFPKLVLVCRVVHP